MVPESILSILDSDPNVPDVYKFKFSNNHRFLERLRVEFFHTKQPNEHVVTTTRFFWDGDDAPILDSVFRLRNAYDQEGDHTEIEVWYHLQDANVNDRYEWAYFSEDSINRMIDPWHMAVLVTCYATLHPAMSVRRSVRRSVELFERAAPAHKP